MPAAMTRFAATAALLASVPFANGAGTDMCVLFIAEGMREFHFGKVDFQAKKIADLASLPPTVNGAGGGVAAGADEGIFYIPNPSLAYNALVELNVLKNTSTVKIINPPIPYKGSVPAFYTMEQNDATGDIFAVLEESTAIRWVTGASVDPVAGTSTALTPDFAGQWLHDFSWIKVGVATVDSTRNIFYFVAGVNNNETLVGFKTNDPSAPVVFAELPGPAGNSSDIDFLGYSASLDLFVASCFSINTGVASIKTMPGAGGFWTTKYVWPLRSDNDMELGNADVSEDGRTLYVALTDDQTGNPGYFQFDIASGKLLSSFVIAETEYRGMLTAEVVSC